MGATTLATNLVSQEITRHIKIVNFFGEKIVQGVLEVSYVLKVDWIDDILTKSLSDTQF